MAGLAGIVAGWQGLTDAQRQAWNEFAIAHPLQNSIGTRIVNSGFQRFCGANLQAGAFIISNPPTQFVLPVSSDVAWSGATLQGATVHQGFTSMEWRSSGVVTPGTMSPPGRGKWWKHIWGAGYAGSGTSVENLSTPFASVFGLPASGDWLWIEVRVSVFGRRERWGRFRLQVP